MTHNIDDNSWNFYCSNWRKWRKWHIIYIIYKYFFVFPIYSIYFIKFFSHTIIYASFASFASFQYKKYTKIGVKMVFFWNSLIKKYHFLVQVEVFLCFSAKIMVNLHWWCGKCEVSNIFWKICKKYLEFEFF